MVSSGTISRAYLYSFPSLIVLVAICLIDAKIPLIDSEKWELIAFSSPSAISGVAANSNVA